MLTLYRHFTCVSPPFTAVLSPPLDRPFESGYRPFTAILFPRLFNIRPFTEYFQA
jgi:hypothetical protein